MNEKLELKLDLELQSWLDGELSARKARRTEPTIVGDDDARHLIAELHFVKTAMAGNEVARTVPESREFYFSKIQKEIQRREGRHAVAPVKTPQQPVWRAWLVPFMGFASLACMLILASDPFAPDAIDETSAVADGTEAVTYHDQAAGMTVIWLSDTTKTQDQASSAVQTE
jgi:hypothetical protein